jgi:hypothetical protein
MTSAAQIEANRTNAAHATGPKSPGGKERASRNAIRHGLRSELPVLPGEQAEQWESHREGVLRSLAPVGSLEQEFAERVALCLWRLRRVAAFETATATARIEGVEDETRRQMEGEGVPFGEPSDARELAKTEKELAKVRQHLAEGETGLSVVEHVRCGSDDSTPVDGNDAATVLEWCNDNVIPEEAAVDLSDDSFLARLDLPEEAADDCWDWGGWTVGLVRQGLDVLGTRAKMAPEKLQDSLIAVAGEYVADKREQVRGLEKQAQTLRRRVKALEQRKRQQRVLPDPDTLNKVMRYEAHVSRQMLQALHTLERLQAARAGADVPPPAALDLTLNGESPALEMALENAAT